MTKDEIQKGYHDKAVVDTNAPKHKQCPAYYTHDGWFQGAEWMQKQMVEKACETYCKVCDTKECYNGELCDWVIKYRKALEGSV